MKQTDSLDRSSSPSAQATSEEGRVSGLGIWFRWGVNLAVFLVAFASIGAWLCEQRPWTRHHGLKYRIRHLYSAEPAYDTLFIGSSRLHRGLAPAVFDQRMAELGKPTRSFSLALAGMRPHEVDVVLRKLLENPPPGLRRVVIELARWVPAIAEVNRLKPRTCAWHTPQQLLPILRSESRWSRAHGDWAPPALMEHITHFIAYWTNFGEGPTAWQEWGESQSVPRNIEEQFAELRGFEPLVVDDDADLIRRRREFEDELEGKFAKLLQRKRIGVADDREGDILNPEALAEQCYLVMQHEVELIYIVPPNILGLQVPEWLTGSDALVPCIRFDRPDEYPELFEPEVLFDAGHLNHRGAELWSAMLAERFVEIL